MRVLPWPWMREWSFLPSTWSPGRLIISWRLWSYPRILSWAGHLEHLTNASGIPPQTRIPCIQRGWRSSWKRKYQQTALWAVLLARTLAYPSCWCCFHLQSFVCIWMQKKPRVALAPEQRWQWWNKRCVGLAGPGTGPNQALHSAQAATVQPRMVRRTLPAPGTNGQSAGRAQCCHLATG